MVCWLEAWCYHCWILQQSYNPNEDYTDAEIELRGRLATFLDSAKSFNVIYAKVRRDSLLKLPGILRVQNLIRDIWWAGNSTMDSYDGRSPASWARTGCKSFVGVLWSAIKGKSSCTMPLTSSEQAQHCKVFIRGCCTVAAKLAENARFVLRGGSRIGCSCWCGIGGVVVGEIGSWVWGSIATSQQWAQHTFIVSWSWLVENYKPAQSVYHISQEDHLHNLGFWNYIFWIFWKPWYSWRISGLIIWL